MSKFAGKVALVTGGSSGIGLATAKALVDEGAYVYITGRRQKELDKAVEQIGNNVTAVQTDVSKLTDLDRLYETIKQQHDHIDVLFANAGVGEFVPFGAITEEHFDTIFDTNVKGVLFTVQKALPLLTDGSAIVLNGSNSSVKGLEAFSVYSATKATLRSFARTWTTDLKSRKFRVNVVSPGPTDTPALTRIAPNNQPDEFKAALADNPSGRIADPAEIAKAVLFLASDDSSFIAGTELFIDGGSAQV